MSFQAYVESKDDKELELPSEFVIALDGGGVRCVLQLGILERLVKIFPQLLQRTTLLAGTSAGSFLACTLAQERFDLAEQLFSKDNVQAIFSRTWTECFSHGWGLWRPKYEPDELQRILTEAFGDKTLSSMPKRLLVTSFDVVGQRNSEDPKHHNYGVQHWSPKIYDNFTECSETIVEITLRSSAAPCYFPSHAQYVDGGVVANNPSAHAISRLVQEGVPLNQITLLSLGSGNNPFHVEATPNVDWGYAQWAPLLLNLVMDAPSEGVVVMSKQLLGERFHRCNPILPQAVELDDGAAFDQLQALAAQCDLLPTIDFLYHHFFPDIPPMISVDVEL